MSTIHTRARSASSQAPFHLLLYVAALVTAWSLIDQPLNLLLCAAVILLHSRTAPKPTRPIPPEVRRRKRPPSVVPGLPTRPNGCASWNG
jgi:hypothetical protein